MQNFEIVPEVNYEPYIYRRSLENPTDKMAYRKVPKSRGRAGNLAAFLMIAVLFCFTFFVADLYSNNGILAVWQDKNDTISETFYVYCVASYHSNSQGLVSAEAVKDTGGAGYLFLDGKYYIAAAIYKTETEAEKVKNATSNLGGTVYCLSVPDPNLEWCAAKHKNKVKKAISAAYLMYDSLYEISVRLDEGNIDLIDVIAKINVLSEQIKTLTDDYVNSVSSQKEFGYVKVKTYLLVLDALLSNVRAEILAGKNASGAVRYAYCCALFLAQATAKSL